MRKLYKPVHGLWISVMWWLREYAPQYLVVAGWIGLCTGDVPALAPSRPLG
ncbi:MAG: hypothetical protein JJU08_10110 [Rhodobacteraceae bacterium]|nr:hypothetical protein [Paracoccaceae bacterium]